MNNRTTRAINAINAATAYADEAGQLIACKCRALMVGYARRWADDAALEPLEVERTLAAKLVNPDTQRTSRTWDVAGKLDLVVLRDGKLVLIDHKTCSEDVTDPAATYWRQLVVESQPSHYMLLKWLLGEKLDEATWDVIRKPSISPRQLKSKAERALAVSSRTWFGGRLSDASLDWLQTNDRESLEMYEYRLVHDCVNERPEWYFQRRSVPRSDDELVAYARELWDMGQVILSARNDERWPRHPSSCMAYGRPCDYLGICSGFDSPESARWRRREQVHSELPIDCGRETLTYSSLRTFQACPRKYFYRYEMGIERADAEDSEALRFGSLLHTALEAYWLALLPEENEREHLDTEPASSVGCEATVPF